MIKWGLNVFIVGKISSEFIFLIRFHFKDMARLLLIFVIALFVMYGCEDENISTDPSLKLSFSSDTIMFDTVFTTIGSSTRYLKVYNRNRHDLRISSVQLAGGSSSCYRINVDGVATDRVEDITIRHNDSLYVFVEVTIDPTSQNAPLYVPDSIVFITNGNVQDVNLIAWGQDVHLLNATTIEHDTVFTSDKPYLIYDYLFVKPETELVIQAGARLHFHNQAQLIVAGTLRVIGELENKVVFEGDRLESFYRDKAGQWGGLWLYAGSSENEISWAEIRNAIIGLVVDTCVTSSPTLTIKNSIVENMSSYCLLGRGSKIVADNCLFSNAGSVCVGLVYGGAFQFYHCTIANYWGQYIFRKGPALLVNNYYAYQLIENGPWYCDPRDLEEAFFYNCIIYGSRDQEFETDYKFNEQPVSALLNYRFDHCILRVPSGFDLTNTSHFIDIINENPKFKDTDEFNFELDTLSPAKDYGLLEVGQLFPIDLLGINHTLDSKPDLGAYERRE